MFAEGDFPVIDSSTARKPVTAELYNLFVESYGYEGSKPLCSTTHGAWLNIADRKADIALLAAPTEEEQAYLRERGVEIEMKLYGGDGLVFIGNKANPVTNLTHEQIIGIYRGRITNWSEVGGPDHPITVYYRDDQSGSQRLFEKLVFKGQSIPDFEKLDFQRLDEMSTIVDTILEDPWSIGYSIMTYLDDVYAEENLQVFSVNGVNPSPDTVKDASYPYHTQGYVVIRKDEPADSPARRLYNWFGCKVSDELLTDCGVSPLHEGVG
jgi:phosphate transport system substrate-binding protein